MTVQDKFIESVIDFSLRCVRADVVCENFCKVKKGDFLAGKLEYELARFKRKYLIAVGKAACSMAKHMYRIMEFDGGLIATDKDCNVGCGNIDIFKSSHPLPNNESIRAGECLISLAKESRKDDLFVFLISGGASSLIEKSKIDLDKYRNILAYMLRNHFSIEEINVVRKALSQIKGGKILRYIDGEVVSFIISDVVGDDLSVVGSGLTYYDKFSQKDFVEVCQKLDGFDVCKFNYDTLSKDDFLFKRVTNHIIASNANACACLEEYLRNKGFNVLNLGSYMKGKIEWVSDILFDAINRAVDGSFGVKPPFALVFGGETTVEVKENGNGGRCQHLALMMAKRLESLPGNFTFVSFATDGKDGNSDFSGAIVNREILKRADELSLDVDEYIRKFDSSVFFEKTGGAIKSFDTLTNVADVGFFLYE